MIHFTHSDIAALRAQFKNNLPYISINCVLFKYFDKELQVAIIRPAVADFWCLPGGYMNKTENLDAAAKRLFFELTQTDHSNVTQFGTFGAADRIFPTEIKDFREYGLPEDIINWISQRKVTIGYYAIAESEDVEINNNMFFKMIKWVNLEDNLDLAMGHNELLSEAKKVLSQDLLSKPVLSSFLPDKFTIPEFQKLYELILGRSIDRGNFRQRVLKSNILEIVGVASESGKGRRPNLYKINKGAYLDSLVKEVKLGF